ncbi:RimJ/RimL family protein N-acetyltransferase [Paenibacillus turicensis]|uniref:RimJ/RimL family protein N-acetyltransferase n=1 Tax=Paenibacillus turicensis TaxID=160487 RepID=A0ABS4FNR4_9BACL|nr:GNAT family protein [Paenibacillus turicensis]MBP1903988.1 RimJ/RimL family protein N-acetyltransferase [Paenibacillus turicensis]
MNTKEHVYAITERLILRQFALKDIQAFYQYRADPTVARFQSWENFTYEEADSFVRSQKTLIPDQPGGWFQYAIALADSNQLIGDCAVHTLGAEPRIAEIGFTLAREHQGKGYIHEALCALLDYIFSTLNKHKVIAFTDVRNEKSISALARLGMRREGHLLQNYMTKGNWVDEYQYAILQSEWLSKDNIKTSHG